MQFWKLIIANPDHFYTESREWRVRSTFYALHAQLCNKTKSQIDNPERQPSPTAYNDIYRMHDMKKKSSIRLFTT